ncbi:MAG: VanZ family protein [Gammaproteobacteria bacterium]|nr:VanZ family protein [Gammaproteobacteria bacterium]
MSRQLKKLHYHQIWLFIGYSLIVLVVYLSLNTGGAHGIGSFLNDKISHFLGYTGLMLWFSQLYRTVKIRSLLVILLIFLGVALEYLQGFGGVRVFEVADMVANASGVVFGWLLALTGLDRTLYWFEGRFLIRC